jgi:hypothetical protein
MLEAHNFYLRVLGLQPPFYFVKQTIHLDKATKPSFSNTETLARNLGINKPLMPVHSIPGIRSIPAFCATASILPSSGLDGAQPW